MNLLCMSTTANSRRTISLASKSPWHRLHLRSSTSRGVATTTSSPCPLSRPSWKNHRSTSLSVWPSRKVRSFQHWIELEKTASQLFFSTTTTTRSLSSSPIEETTEDEVGSGTNYDKQFSPDSAWKRNLGRRNDDAWLTGPRLANWYTGVHPSQCPGKFFQTKRDTRDGWSHEHKWCRHEVGWSLRLTKEIFAHGILSVGLLVLAIVSTLSP